ncbi:MAG: SsrA-binding protein SmpB [Planctomycetota bacterium]|jgi:SsrA-binding protein
MAKGTSSGNRKSKGAKGGRGEAAEERKVIARNRRAFHKYVILEKVEAGVVLTGPEVKSLRNGQCVITEAYARLRGGEVWLFNMDVGHYQPAFHVEQLARRTRKLLLKRREIAKWARRLDESGTTMVPLLVYFQKGLAKVELALVRGTREYDKRQRAKANEARREIRSKMQTQNRGRKNRRR